MLAAEGLDPDALEVAARRGERLAGSTTTRIVCWPTCRHARRTQQRYRVAFRSLRDAASAGYRPCKVCRPTSVEAAA
jgi:methylphosphotriester-DNA--protein-cysteine methyltransferase